uniref:NADH dehydrogenase [ubiquinone] 1 beta subcomplex subunit 5, mitochondrial n=1 Tax=Panagrolaimus superbus TaxID=310955 RepID=A0A914YPZ5_9BILA
MTHLSKLASCGAIARSTFGKLRPQSFSVQSIRLSHSHLFRRRNGQLIVNRVKDMAHFYMIALGTLPFLFACAYSHIVYDMEHHERNLAYFERQGILTRWRRTEDRVKHLQGELADYKGYFYMPVSAQWIDYGRYMANRQRDQYESHASYAN